MNIADQALSAMGIKEGYKPVSKSALIKRKSRRLRKETGLSARERKEYADFCAARGDVVIVKHRPAVPITETVSYSVLNRRGKDSLVRMIIRDRARIKELELALGKL